MWHPKLGQYTCTAGTGSVESEAEECPAAAMLVTEVEVVDYFLTKSFEPADLSNAGTNLKRDQQLFNMNAHALSCTDSSHM